MKVTPRNIAIVLWALILTALQIAIQDLFNFIPLFFLKWPIYTNVIVILLFVISSLRWENSKFDKFLKRMSVINIPLNIVIWIMALISFINGTINCNPIVFYVLFGINAFLTITKIPKMLKDEEDKKTQTEPVKNE